MKDTYLAIKERVDRISETALWPGFVPGSFAIYNDTHAYTKNGLIPRPENFVGNTAISFEGESIGIWNIVGGEDLDILAGNMVHEMYHAYQFGTGGEDRLPDELSARIHAPDPLCVEMRIAENRCLIAGDADGFCRMRRARQELFPVEVRYESLCECLEGAAEYIGVKATAVLDPEKAEGKLRLFRERMLDPRWIVRNNRMAAYYSGLFLLRLDESIPHELGGKTFWEHFEEKQAPGKAAVPSVTPGVADALNEEMERRRAIMNPFLEKKLKEVHFDSFYTFESLNTFWCDGRVFCPYFVALGTGDNYSFSMGDHIIELTEDGKIARLLTEDK